MDRAIRYKLYVVGCLLLILPFYQYTINEMREPIVPTRSVHLSITPGEFVGTLLLGGFRGIAVDILWLRVHRLQQEEKFFELIALTDLIAKLQPHDRMVWEFNAWNRAYNVSIYFQEREDRWTWVKSGLELNLQGIRRMPENWKLRANLAHMFMHKCADYREETKRDFGEDNFTLARRYYQETLQLNPDAPLYVDRAIIHTYEKQGDFRKAQEKYDRHLTKFPNDTIAMQNRDEFLKEKEQYHYFLNEAQNAFEERRYQRVIEIYEDNITGKRYLLPSKTIDVILFSYIMSEEYDSGIRFIHRRMNLKMEYPEKIFALYREYIEKYNKHYHRKFSALRDEKKYREIINLYHEKFKEKKVDISLKNGIILVNAIVKTGALDAAGNVLIDLSSRYPHEEELLQLKNRVKDIRTDEE